MVYSRNRIEEKNVWWTFCSGWQLGRWLNMWWGRQTRPRVKVQAEVISSMDRRLPPVNCSITAPALLWSTGDARGLDRLCSCDLTEQEKLEDGHLEMALALKLNPIFYCPRVLFFFFFFLTLSLSNKLKLFSNY